MPDDREGLTWTREVGAGAWIAERLTVGDTVPRGFEQYAQILHPAFDSPRAPCEPVRWRDVATWSGIPLRAGTDFASIAIPQEPRSEPPPWTSQGPQSGQLFLPYLRALQGILAEETTTPDESWFGLWDGYGWIGGSARGGVAVFMDSSIHGTAAPDPIPAAVPEGVLDGPKLDLPHRSYLLFKGFTTHADQAPFGGAWEQTPNIWWPEDRAWFVATEIDLSWTYVGGSKRLIERLVSDERIEAISTDPFAERRTMGWIQLAAEAAARQLVESAKAAIATPIGSVKATLEPLRKQHSRLVIDTQSAIMGGESRSETTIGIESRDRLEQLLAIYLVAAVHSLVG